MGNSYTKSSFSTYFNLKSIKNNLFYKLFRYLPKITIFPHVRLHNVKFILLVFFRFGAYDFLYDIKFVFKTLFTHKSDNNVKLHENIRLIKNEFYAIKISSVA